MWCGERKRHTTLRCNINRRLNGYFKFERTMLPWLLLILTAVFVALAIDAYRLATPSQSVPFSVTAEAIGQDASHLPLHEQEELKTWNHVYGLGKLNQSVWLFAILAFGSGVATVFAFLE